MARVEPEALADRELERVYIAATLAEARRVEQVLTQQGVNYIVQAEPFGRTLFGSPRTGAAFYVEVGQAQYCGAQLVAAGLKLGLLVEEASDS